VHKSGEFETDPNDDDESFLMNDEDEWRSMFPAHYYQQQSPAPLMSILGHWDRQVGTTHVHPGVFGPPGRNK
jgi:hypothetical protein